MIPKSSKRFFANSGTPRTHERHMFLRKIDIWSRAFLRESMVMSCPAGQVSMKPNTEGSEVFALWIAGDRGLGTVNCDTDLPSCGD